MQCSHEETELVPYLSSKSCAMVALMSFSTFESELLCFMEARILCFTGMITENGWH